MPIRPRILPVWFCLLAVAAVGQTQPVLDQNPTSLHWYRLQTPHFRLLYPDGFAQPAQQTARRLEQVYVPVSASLNRPPRPISIILQNQTTISNGFVTLLPRRSEFFATPPQDPFLSGTLPWLDLLAVHEFRHVVQFEKALTGFSKGAYTLLGYGALAGLTVGVPDWFAEGDAVGTETLLSQSGRGRMPAFDLGFRANLLAGERFSYPKAVDGSYRDNVPNHYVLGYLLTTFAKRQFGADLWSRVLDRYYRFPLYPFSFSNSLKKETGLRVEELYRQTLVDAEETYRKQQEGLPITPVTFFATQPEQAGIGQTRPVFTNYKYPQYVDDSTVLTVKSGLGDISQLVLLTKGGQEKRVLAFGLFNDPDLLSVAGGKVCWVEFRYDPRWGQRVYSEIKVLTLKTGQLTRITHRSRYTVATLSPDGRWLAAVRSATNGQNQLVVLDAQTGAEHSTVANPTNDFWLHPRWQADGSRLVVVTLKAGGKTIEQLDTETGSRQALLPLSNQNLSHPQPWGEYVLYNSPQSGIDNLYAVHTLTGKVLQVTSRPLGAYHAVPSPDGKRLAFHDFSATGFRIAEMPLNPADWTPVGANQSTREVRFFGPLLTKDPGVAQLRAELQDTLPPAKSFPVSRYNRLAHAINIYSYGPTVASTNNNLTAAIISQDLLNTTQVEAGYQYNQAERVGNAFANLSYQALYPVIDLGFQSGNRQTIVNVGNNRLTDRWHYNQLTAGLRLPFRLTRSRFTQNASLSAYYSYLGVQGYDLPGRYLTEIGNRSLSSLVYGASYSALLRQSKRDVAPRLGIALSGVLRTTPFSNPGDLYGQQWSVSGSLYLPGLLKHHAIRFRGAYQEQWGTADSRNLYLFQASVLYPRGADYVAFDKLRVGSAEYRLPLLSPHWTLGRLLYIQRVKGLLFSDYARGESQVAQVNSRGQVQAIIPVRGDAWTVGGDVSFVFNALRLRTPFEAGVRTSYNVRTGGWLVQPLVLDIGF